MKALLLLIAALLCVVILIQLELVKAPTFKPITSQPQASNPCADLYPNKESAAYKSCITRSKR